MLTFFFLDFFSQKKAQDAAKVKKLKAQEAAKKKKQKLKVRVEPLGILLARYQEESGIPCS